MLVLGAANLDVTAVTPTTHAVADSLPGQVRFSPGGVGRNIAENLARLGLPVALLAQVGDDAAAQAILVPTARAGVDVSRVLEVRDYPSNAYVALHGLDGDLLAAVNAMALCASEHLSEKLPEPWLPSIATAGVLVTDANLPELWLREALTQVHRHADRHQGSMPFCVADGTSAHKVSRLRSVLPQLDLLKVNRLEAQTLLGEPDTQLGASDAVTLAQRLQSLGPKAAVVSLGGQGLAWATSSQAAHLPAIPALQWVSSSGAGDALLSGLLAGLWHGRAWEQALQLGQACAVRTLASAQTCVPELSDLIKEF